MAGIRITTVGIFLSGILVDTTGSPVNDWQPSGVSQPARTVVIVVRATSFLATDITGLFRSELGQVVWIVNGGGSTVQLMHESVNSIATMRFDLNNGATKVLSGLGGSAGIIGNDGDGRWSQFTP